MSCPDHQTISAFADGELELAQAAEVERHIAQCASCRQLAEELRWVDDRGRAALRAIHVEEPNTANIVWWKSPARKWARPLSLAAAASVVLFLSIGIWIASSHFQTAVATHQIESVTTTPESDGPAKEPDDVAFEQWTAPYRELHIPLVSMEVAENYRPAVILPIQPEDIERKHQ